MRELIDLTFLALTSFDVDQLTEYASRSKFINTRNKFIFDDFKICLSKYNMVEYATPLYNYMIIALKRHFNYTITEPRSISQRRQELVNQEELVNLLKILCTENSIKSISIKCRKSFPQKSLVISNGVLINSIARSAVDSIWEEVERLGLNMFSITKNEAIEQINNQKDVEWIKRWMEEMGFSDHEYTSFTLDKVDSILKSANWRPVIPNSSEKIKDVLIEEYIYDHKYSLPLDLATVEKILNAIKAEKSKRGRKEDTLVLKSIAYSLAVLIHSEAYLKNESIESINDIPISGNDHYFIHDVLVFFGLMETYKDSPKNEKILKKRINKILHDNNDQSYIDDIDEKFRILKYDLANPA